MKTAEIKKINSKGRQSLEIILKLPVKLKLENGLSAEQGKKVNRERTNKGQLNR